VKTVIFAGPSISRQKLERMTDAELAPPIRRGDLTAFADYDVFVIIDGEFGQSLSVSPKEILTLLDQGKVIIGASSMGALRASELDPYGMIGVGWVYQRFACAEVRRDDDVALAFSPIDFAALTVPMVDIEYWLECLQTQGCISKVEISVILRTARRIFFAERTEVRLMHALEQMLGRQRLQDLLAATAGEIPDIKQLDAEQAVGFSTASAIKFTACSARVRESQRVTE
jgi:TfuA protein